MEEDFRTDSRAKLLEKLQEASRASYPAKGQESIDDQLEEAFSGTKVSEPEDAKELADWARAEFGLEVPEASLTGVSKEQARDVLWNAYDARYRPEMRRMERSLLLGHLDSAWKNHLYTMDHLRSGIGLYGYAQEDPKIMYKQEGMKEFKSMWEAMEDKVTDTIFRIEETEAFQESVWVIGDDAARRRPAGDGGRQRGDHERRRATRSRSRSATARRRSAATTRARAAAARSTRTATCARRRCDLQASRERKRPEMVSATSSISGRLRSRLAISQCRERIPMRWLLDALYLAALTLLSPWLIYRSFRTGKYRRGLGAKLLGLSASPTPSARPVWFHGVSVGEIHLLRQVIASFRRLHPDRPCVVSTTTDTGHDEARRCFPDLPVFYFPFDFSWAVRRTLRRVDSGPDRAGGGRTVAEFPPGRPRRRRARCRHQRPHEPTQRRRLPPPALG